MCLSHIWTCQIKIFRKWKTDLSSQVYIYNGASLSLGWVLILGFYFVFLGISIFNFDMCFDIFLNKFVHNSQYQYICFLSVGKWNSNFWQMHLYWLLLVTSILCLSAPFYHHSLNIRKTRKKNERNEPLLIP